MYIYIYICVYIYICIYIYIYIYCKRLGGSSVQIPREFSRALGVGRQTSRLIVQFGRSGAGWKCIRLRSLHCELASLIGSVVSSRIQAVCAKRVLENPKRHTAEFIITRLYRAPVFTVFLHDKRPRKGTGPDAKKDPGGNILFS